MNPLEQYLADVKERAGKATEAPWKYNYALDRVFTDPPNVSKGGDGTPVKQIACFCSNIADGDFISASRTDIPRLVAIAETALEALETAHMAYQGMMVSGQEMAPIIRDIIRMGEKEVRTAIAACEALSKGEGT